MNSVVTPIGASSLYIRILTYMVISYFPLALLDIRLPLPGLVVRLSDIYLIFLAGLFFLSGVEAQRWMVRCIVPFIPVVLYIALHALVTGNMRGLFEPIQWLLTLCWIPLCSFVFRQSEVSHIKILWAFILGVALYTAVTHLMQGYTYGFKHMAGAKYSFGFSVLLGCLLIGRVHFILWTPLMIVCVVFLILSDERKDMLFNALTLVGFLPLLSLIRLRAVLTSVYALVLLLLFSSGPILYYGFIRGDVAVTHFVDEEMASWNSDLHRGSLITNGVDLFLQRPIFGQGPKQLVELMDDYYIDPNLGLSTHNFYLDFLVEYGLVGVLLLLLPALILIAQVRRDHPHSLILLPLGFYGLCVPMFMETGTTTMITFFTGLACIFSSGWRTSGEKGSNRGL